MHPVLGQVSRVCPNPHDVMRKGAQMNILHVSYRSVVVLAIPREKSALMDWHKDRQILSFRFHIPTVHSLETTATRVFLEQNQGALAQHCEKASLISKFQMLILSISFSVKLQIMCSGVEMWNITLLESVLIFPELFSVCVINARVEQRLCTGIGVEARRKHSSIYK